MGIFTKLSSFLDTKSYIIIFLVGCVGVLYFLNNSNNKEIENLKLKNNHLSANVETLKNEIEKIELHKTKVIEAYELKIDTISKTVIEYSEIEKEKNKAIKEVEKINTELDFKSFFKELKGVKR